MKKLFICLTLITLLLVSCSTKEKQPTLTPVTPPVEEPVTTSPDVDAPSTEPDNVEQPTETPSAFKDFEYKITTYDWVEMKDMTPEEQTREFLSARYLGDREALGLYMQGDTAEELLKVKFGSITYSGKEITKSYEALSGKAYPGFESDVMFEISESDSPFFPVGSYCFKLLVMSPSSFAVEYFGKPEAYEDFSNYSRKSATYSPETLLESFYFVENLFSYYSLNSLGTAVTVTDDNFDSLFHVIVHELMESGENFIFTTTLEDFKKHVGERLGCTDKEMLDRFANKLKNSSFSTPDENGVYTGSCAHGYNSLARFPYSIYENGNEQFITYGIFADSAYTVQCAQVDFYFEKQDGADTFTIKKINYRNVVRENAPTLTPYVFTP